MIFISCKRRRAPRLLTYSIIKKDPLLSAELEGYAYNDSWHQVKALLLKPAAFFRWKLLEKQDFFASFLELKKPNHFKQEMVPRNISWDKLANQAEEEAAKQAGNNPFGLLNSYYNTQKKSIEKSKNTWKPNHFLESSEYDDLHMTLDILSSEHAQPLFILLPRKGDKNR